MDVSYILNELGEDREDYFGAVIPPIIQSANFAFSSLQKMREGLEDEMGKPFYTRGHNPTVAILRKKIAALCGAEDGLVFGSGSAAMAAGVMNVVKAGDHVVCVQKPYSWTKKLLNNLLVKYGVETTMIDGSRVEHWEAALRENTVLFILESPNSLTFEMQPIKAVAHLAKSKGITTLIDNSYASPLHQQPISLGIDMEMHTASKYLGGHSDIVGGVLCGTKKRMQSIFESEFMTLGATISPHDAWLILRGMRTLPIRLARVTDTAEQLVTYLEQHPKVDRVIYPFSPNHPQFALAQKQMKRGAGQFTLVLKTQDIEAVERFCDALKRFLMACSWGGHESLIFPVAALYGSANYSNTDQPFNMVRCYAGLEEAEGLIQDLEQALACI